MVNRSVTASAWAHAAPSLPPGWRNGVPCHGVCECTLRATALGWRDTARRLLPPPPLPLVACSLALHAGRSRKPFHFVPGRASPRSRVRAAAPFVHFVGDLGCPARASAMSGALGLLPWRSAWAVLRDDPAPWATRGTQPRPCIVAVVLSRRLPAEAVTMRRPPQY